MVYVLNVNGEPIMPTNRYRHVRKLLKSKRAKIVGYEPFTIQLTYKTRNKTQDIELTVDTGYENIGISACSDNAELYSTEVKLLTDMSKRISERRKYRRTRRNRLRYRAPRFDNRRRPEGWLPPSIQHKYDTHIKLINKVTTFLPVTKIVAEIGLFDTQKIKNPDIKGKEYQQGEMKGFKSLRDYVFYRDNYTCQICGKGSKEDGITLHMHHLEYWNHNNRTNIPANCITLCAESCHTPPNHAPAGILYGKRMKQKSLKGASFMSIIGWRLIDDLTEQQPSVIVEAAYGHNTKDKRIKLGLEKTHYNDAYCIGNKQPKERLANTLIFKQQRKNARDFENFYDAQYIDKRDDTKKSGKELFSGRTTRNTNLNSENLHKYSGQKLSKGRRAIRKQRYAIRPNDSVIYRNRIFKVTGIHQCGKNIVLKHKPKNYDIRVNKIKQKCFSKTIYLENEIKAG